MKHLLLLSFLTILLYGCTEHSTKTVETFDYCDYHYPLGSLKEPKVFVYINDSTGKRMYMAFDTIGSTDDPILNRVDYDTAFNQRLFIKTKLGKDSITILETIYYELDSTRPFKAQLTKFVNARKQPLGDESTYIIERIRPKSNKFGKMRTTYLDHFNRIATPSGQNYYKGHDCIICIVENQFTPLDKSSDIKPYGYISKYYYAKGIGQIYSEMPRKGYIETYRLEKIISLEDFEKMKNAYITANASH